MQCREIEGFCFWFTLLFLVDFLLCHFEFSRLCSRLFTMYLGRLHLSNIWELRGQLAIWNCIPLCFLCIPLLHHLILLFLHLYSKRTGWQWRQSWWQVRSMLQQLHLQSWHHPYQNKNWISEILTSVYNMIHLAPPYQICLLYNSMQTSTLFFAAMAFSSLLPVFTDSKIVNMYDWRLLLSLLFFALALAFFISVTMWLYKSSRRGLSLHLNNVKNKGKSLAEREMSFPSLQNVYRSKHTGYYRESFCCTIK